MIKKEQNTNFNKFSGHSLPYFKIIVMTFNKFNQSYDAVEFDHLWIIRNIIVMRTCIEADLFLSIFAFFNEVIYIAA